MLDVLDREVHDAEYGLVTLNFKVTDPEIRGRVYNSLLAILMEHEIIWQGVGCPPCPSLGESDTDEEWVWTYVGDVPVGICGGILSVDTTLLREDPLDYTRQPTVLDWVSLVPVMKALIG